MQKLRSEWIDEFKPKPDLGNDSDEPGLSDTHQPGSQPDPSPQDANLTPDGNIRVAADAEQTSLQDNAAPSGLNASETIAGAPDGDELDELLAEQDVEPETVPDLRTSSNPISQAHAPSKAMDFDDDFGDDEAAMREMGF